MANQHGDNGGLELLGGSQVIALDGTVAAAARQVCRYLVARLPLRESLSRAAQESGPLLACRRPALYAALTALAGRALNGTA